MYIDKINNKVFAKICADGDMVALQFVKDNRNKIDLSEYDLKYSLLLATENKHFEFVIELIELSEMQEIIFQSHKYFNELIVGHSISTPWDSPQRQIIENIIIMKPSLLEDFMKVENFYRGLASIVKNVAEKNIDITETSIDLIVQEMSGTVSIVYKAILESTNVKNKELLNQFIIKHEKLELLPDEVKDVFFL